MSQAFNVQTHKTNRSFACVSRALGAHTQRFLGARIRTVAGVTVLLDRDLSGLEPSDLFESGKVRIYGFSEFSEGCKVPFVLDCHVELSDLLKDHLLKAVKDLLTGKSHFFFC